MMTTKEHFEGLSKMWNDHLDKYRWHDYQKEGIPMQNGDYLVCIKDKNSGSIDYDVRPCNGFGFYAEWHEKILAWKEIEEFSNGKNI